MLFKLAFNKTTQGTLRVSASTVRGSDHVLSIHDNDEAFKRLLEHSELNAHTISSLKGSAKVAYGSQNTPTCSGSAKPNGSTPKLCFFGK